MVDSQSLVPVARRRSVNAWHHVQQLGGVAIGVGLVGIWGAGGLAATIGYPLIGLYLVGASMVTRRQGHKFVVESEVAGDAMIRGDFAKAFEIFDYWSDIANNKRIMVMSCHNLAVICMHQGKLEESNKFHLENSEFELKALRRMNLTQLSAACVAYTHGLLGQLDAATKWIGLAERRSQPPQMTSAEPTQILARVVVELRRGNSDEAAKLLDDNWTMIEGRVTSRSVRTYRLMRAFARGAAGPREAGRMHEDLVALRPQYFGEHAYLGKAWPEMAAFLTAHALN